MVLLALGGFFCLGWFWVSGFRCFLCFDCFMFYLSIDEFVFRILAVITVCLVICYGGFWVWYKPEFL